MNETQYQYEGATFDIQYEIDWRDSRDSTYASIISIKHKGVEFMDILHKETIDFFEEELNNRIAWDGIDPQYDHKYERESHD
jgi:hypothetical protein